MLLWLLDVGRAIVGAVKDWHWFVPCLVSWGLFRGNYVVLWLNSLRWRHLTCYSRLRSFVACCIVDSIVVLSKLYWPVNICKWIFLNIYIVCNGVLRNFEVGVRICLTTIVIVVITSTIRVNLSLVFFSFEVTALPSIVTWLFSVVAGWFGFFLGFVVWLVASQYLSAFHLVLSSHSIPIPFQDVTQSVHMYHSVRLVDWFPQVGRHFAIYEMLNDRLSSNSECIFR